MFEIKNNLIYVEGKETRNPELIGYAILDLVDRLMEKENQFNIITNKPHSIA